MVSQIRKFVTLKFKKRILDSLAYRLYLRSFFGKKGMRFSVEITTKCNINCAMCTRAEMLKKGKLDVGEMKPEIINKVIEEMKKFVDHGYEVTFVPMGLGEPLLYSDFKNIIKRIKKASRKIRVVLVTNGVCLTKEIIKDLIELKIDEISISLNVNNKADYKKYMKADNYSKIKENIENLIKARNKSGFKLPNIYVQYLDYKNNENKFNKDIKDWTKIMKYGDKCYVHPIVNQAGFKKDLLSDLNKEDFPCTSPLSRVAIRINGDVYPCDACFYGGNQKVEELFLGNIEKISLWKIFNNKNSKNFQIVENMKNGDYSKLSICKKCNTYKLSPNCYFKNPITKRWM